MIEYRKAVIDDVEELVRLRIAFLNEVKNIESGYSDPAMEYNLKEYFINNMSTNCFIAWLAVKDGAIVGTSGICFYALPPSYKNISGNSAYIMNMYTLPDYRGKGIAPALFKKLVAEAADRSCKKISLHATDMGKPVYLKFGFKVTDNEMVLNLP